MNQTFDLVLRAVPEAVLAGQVEVRQRPRSVGGRAGGRRSGGCARDGRVARQGGDGDPGQGQREEAEVPDRASLNHHAQRFNTRLGESTTPQW